MQILSASFRLRQSDTAAYKSLLHDFVNLSFSCGVVVGRVGVRRVWGWNVDFTAGRRPPLEAKRVRGQSEGKSLLGIPSSLMIWLLEVLRTPPTTVLGQGFFTRVLDKLHAPSPRLFSRDTRRKLNSHSCKQA